jgi:hypothetical protein
MATVFMFPTEPSCKSYAALDGSGVTGTVTGKAWTDRNTLFLIGLDDARMATLVKGVKELHDRLVEEHEGHEVRLKVFLSPCEEIV